MVRLVGVWHRLGSLKGALMVIAFGASICSSGFAESQNRDPVGEVADYKVDRRASRTSAMIMNGTFRGAVTTSVPDHASGPAYEMQIDYQFRLRLLGMRSGSQVVHLPQDYFSPEFMEDLRASGSFENETLKIQHLGYADARTMDGGFFPHCDKIRIYDVQTFAAGGIVSLARDLFGLYDGQAVADIENLEIVAHIKEGLPVLGAAKIDVSGNYQGTRIKAGADYERP